MALRTPAETLRVLLANSATTETGCRLWTSRRHLDGYAATRWQGAKRQAHRVAYEILVGPIPAGMTLDHLCHTTDPQCVGGPSCLHRACINVDHLEVVSNQENGSRQYRARKTHCANGHPFSEANTYFRTGAQAGRRGCRACNRAAVRRYKERKMLRSAGIAEATQ